MGGAEQAGVAIQYAGLKNFEAWFRPRRAVTELAVLTRASACDDFPCSVVAQRLAGTRDNFQSFAAYRPEHVGFIFTAIKHARTIKGHIPDVCRADGRRRRGPVPVVEHVDEWVTLGQGGQFGSQAEQAAKFAAIGHAPNVQAETRYTVHGCDEIQ